MIAVRPVAWVVYVLGGALYLYSAALYVAALGSREERRRRLPATLFGSPAERVGEAARIPLGPGRAQLNACREPSRGLPLSAFRCRLLA